MSYTSVAFVREITGRYGVKQTDFTDERIQDAIDSAEGLINGYAAGTYIIPFVQGGVVVLNDKLLNRLCADLAAYDIVLTYQGSQTIEQGDPVSLRHSQAIQTLQSVSTGKISWPYDSVESGPGLPANIATVGQYSGDLFGPSDFEIRDNGFDRGGRFYGRGPYGSGSW